MEANLEGANLTGCAVYDVSALGIQLERATQLDLVITSPNEAAITVDNLEVAQFVHLLPSNRRIRELIDSVSSKVVLVLRRFTADKSSSWTASGTSFGTTITRRCSLTLPKSLRAAREFVPMHP